MQNSGSGALFLCAHERWFAGSRNRVLHRSFPACHRLADVVALCALPLPRAGEFASDPQPQSQGERGDSKEVLFLRNFNKCIIRAAEVDRRSAVCFWLAS